ncbi:hypothetical protein [Stutzerimonas kunmingensis]|uniref:hypothetical protein n=2 Tax=Stutzerimonas kunmingensis TaxID=1211807 RepID=UPI001CD12E2B|nr:hypothetical protein [Stutzerimonas kunmingensis]
MADAPTVKVVGTNGEISLDKRFAGRHVLVEEHEPGVWIVRTATVIPDNERWLHEPQATADLQAAIGWSATHAAPAPMRKHPESSWPWRALGRYPAEGKPPEGPS